MSNYLMHQKHFVFICHRHSERDNHFHFSPIQKYQPAFVVDTCSVLKTFHGCKTVKCKFFQSVTEIMILFYALVCCGLFSLPISTDFSVCLGRKADSRVLVLDRTLVTFRRRRTREPSKEK